MPKKGTRISNYVLEKEIGKGSFGTVFLGKDLRTQELRAIKVIQTCKLDSRSSREIELMKAMKHENIIQLYDNLKSDKFTYLFLEYCSGGDLQQKIEETKGMSESCTRVYLRQIADALYYLKEKRIIHRDLKPANILLNSENVAKLADFGLARMLDPDSMAQSYLGTPLYMAPEVLKKMAGGNIDERYDRKADIWSVGCIVYELIKGERLFQATNQAELKNIIGNTIVRRNYLDQNVFSEVCMDFLSKIIVMPENRMNFDSFYEHPFVTGLPSLNKIVSLRGRPDLDTENKNEEKLVQAKKFSKAVIHLKLFKVSNLLDFKACQLLKPLDLTQKLMISYTEHFSEIRTLDYSTITSSKIVEDILSTIINISEYAKTQSTIPKHYYEKSLDLLAPLKPTYMLLKLKKALLNKLDN